MTGNTMLTEFDQRRLFDICQAVKQLSEDGSLISVFGERLVNHVNKNESYAYQYVIFDFDMDKVNEYLSCYH